MLHLLPPIYYQYRPNLSFMQQCVIDTALDCARQSHGGIFALLQNSQQKVSELCLISPSTTFSC